MTEKERIIFNQGFCMGQQAAMQHNEGREPPTRRTVLKVCGLLRLWRTNPEGKEFYNFLSDNWHMTEEELKRYNNTNEKEELFRKGSFLQRIISWFTKKQQ